MISVFTILKFSALIDSKKNSLACSKPNHNFNPNFKGMSATEMEEFLKKGCDMHPMGRLGTIDEVSSITVKNSFELF